MDRLSLESGSNSSDESNGTDSDDNESDDEDVSDDTNWIKGDLEADLPDFYGAFGLSDNVNLPSSPSPMDVFTLFLSSNIVDHIVQQSNLYHTQQNLKQDLMSDLDFYQLLGFLFYASLIKLPSKGDYWSQMSMQEIITNNITRDRIDELLRTLHFSDNALNETKCGKIQPLIDLFNERCALLVDQEEYISIDEQMVGYKGKTAPSSLKQYMPNKPSKHGFKLWSKCGVSAYVYEIQLYSGGNQTTSKPTTIGLANPLARTTRLASTTSDNYEELARRRENIKNVGASGTVVLDLLRNVPEGIKVFVDNYFGSIALIRKVTEMGFGIVCTLRQNRIDHCPLPSEKELRKKDRGFYDYRLSKDQKCVVVAWKDTKRVLIGSNYVATEPIVELARWDKNQKNKSAVTAPQIIVAYNKHMGGVDTTDMLCALHPIPFRSKKWYMRLVWRVFDLMLLNSWLVWKHLLGRNGNWRVERIFRFKLEVARVLLQRPSPFAKPVLRSAQVDSSLRESDDENENYQPPKKRSKRETKLSVSATLRYDGHEHWPQFQQVKHSVRCKLEGCKQRTKWNCSKCNVHLCLHSANNCFKLYHMRS